MKIIRVEQCRGACPYYDLIYCFHPEIDAGKMFNNNRRVVDIKYGKEIPEWCPLEDEKEPE